MLDSFIEYAEKTKRFHDVGNFQDIRERINELEKKLAESVPKGEIKGLSEMWPIFLKWVNDYVGANTEIFGNVSYSREDMRYAFQAGYEILTNYKE